MFHGWDSFYLMIGSAAAGLIGLLFVVATLTTGRDHSAAMRGASLYMSPTVFHFAVVLVISAATQVPGLGRAQAGMIIGAAALAGLIYAASVALRLRRPHNQSPAHWTDLWCYGVYPTAIYLCLAVGAAGALEAASWAADSVAITLLALLLLGIRNAWDLVTWLAPRRSDEP